MTKSLAHLRANVVAYLALFVALGGTSYAAIKLPANSVGSKQIKKGAVTSKKLAKSAKKALRGAAGPAGAPGTPGAPGAKGDKGDTGAPGSARAYAYVNGSVSTPTFDPARTKGFSAVSEPQHGVYCLTAPGLDPAKTAPIVSTLSDVVPRPMPNGWPPLWQASAALRKVSKVQLSAFGASPAGYIALMSRPAYSFM